ncbi:MULTISPECIES: glycerol dehydrogenase [unclassified Gilliamella]|uniref:glycerol dehydrogenase n=1 Tax=unclassified Gilliamella TaxID=2685620 RepID=UPI001CE6F07D|nr:glycerol dehydrogenase [Gilliamella sp. ESL0405]
MMDKVFVSPNRYVQGKDLLTRADVYIKPFGTHFLILADQNIWNIAANQLADSLTNSGLDITKAVFNGECSMVEINRLLDEYKDKKFDAIIGVGGGKTLDTAKALAAKYNIPKVCVPTTASTDAPTAKVSVVYTEDGVFDFLWHHYKNPDLVLVDTRVIANAPVRSLKSGIADGLATWVEARTSIRSCHKTDAGGIATIAGEAIARECEKTIFEYALLAVEANEKKLVTPALEAVVEANTLLSGLGFENGGLGAAHAIHNGFTAVPGDVHHLTHGEKVAYGTIAQLVLEGRPIAELERYIDLYLKLGLPITLEEVHLDKITDEEFELIGKKAVDPVETIHSMPFEVTADDVIQAIKATDYHVKNYKKRLGLN